MGSNDRAVPYSRDEADRVKLLCLKELAFTRIHTRYHALGGNLLCRNSMRGEVSVGFRLKEVWLVEFVKQIIHHGLQHPFRS